ncbi:hypothetical protein CYMTET_6554 [Cymbomonas tetramitiformis]|uniref:Cyclic nucleotide-binding domain-containing protein n=1 Tax=Cymbomonas tetramitiformis TaxID=36881 RepID=A0AAE0LHY2_9CHLO|nr:hypothetical protein CYMTET_6554 [Cymbomonas tetramitiformis]
MVFDEMEIPKGFRAGTSKEELNALVTTDLRGGRRVDPISLRMACRVLQQIPLSKLHLMRTRGKSMSFPAGYPLFIQGDRADALIYLVRGTVNIHSSQPKTSAMGRPNYGPVVDTLEQGVCFGELSLFPEPAIRTVTVVTKDECECVILRRQHIEEEGISPFESRHKLVLTDSENKFLRKREHLRSAEEMEVCYERVVKHPFFQNLPKLAVLRFLKTMRIISLSQEDVLFEQSMPANKIYIVIHGSLSLHNLKRKRQLPAKDEFEEAVEEPKDSMQKDKPHPLLAKPAELVSDDEVSDSEEESASEDDLDETVAPKATSLTARLEEVRKLLIIEGALRPESEEDEDPLALIKT